MNAKPMTDRAISLRGRFDRLGTFEHRALADMIRTARVTYQGERIEQLRRTGQDTTDTAHLLDMDEQGRLFLIELEGE